MTIADLLNKMNTATHTTSADLLAEESRRRARKTYHTEQARAELREAARRAREDCRQARRATNQGPAAGGRTGDRSGAAGRQAPPGPTRTWCYRGKVVADYYEVLEVSPKARQSVIDKAYRALMREDHPDLGGDPRKAQLINEAYEVLGDPTRRRLYDEENGLPGC